MYLNLPWLILLTHDCQMHILKSEILIFFMLLLGDPLYNRGLFQHSPLFIKLRQSIIRDRYLNLSPSFVAQPEKKI